MTKASPTRDAVKQRELDDPFTSPGPSTAPKTARDPAINDDPSQDDNADESEEDGDDNDDDGEEEEEDDEEPKLKYARLTNQIPAVYRNGDATSSFLVSGDKMIVGTHNGNIHVTQLPNFHQVRVYHAHSASVTAISISPYPPPVPKPGPNNPSNNIYVATSSMDGNICVQSLSDPKDVQLRNFARPLQAVALSPDYRNDRTYLSGGRAGQLVLTVGAPTGKSTSTTVGTAAATAAGWLGSVGLGANSGKDTVLHSGEGTVSSIKWSLTGKYVAWLNEHGIKIMRSKIQLDRTDADDAWKRFGHIDRPQTDEWEEMAGVWKGRAEWINEASVDMGDIKKDEDEVEASPAAARLRQQVDRSNKQIERLLVGWGGTLWIIHVHPGSIGTGRNVGEKISPRAEIVKILQMDCIISGVSLYTQNLLLVLAYCLPDDDESPQKGHEAKLSGAGPSGGIRRRTNNQPPELRLIDLTSQAEVDKDGLSVSRFERLTSNDYHLGVLPVADKSAAIASASALETLAGFGTDMLNAALYPRALFSSGASVKSGTSRDDTGSGIRRPSTIGSAKATVASQQAKPTHPGLIKPGLKIFIHSPYDCILATKRDLGDHLAWLLEHQEYQAAWVLLDEHPEILSTADRSTDFLPPTPDKGSSVKDDFFDDASSVMPHSLSAVEHEKRRIGEHWIQELIESGNWQEAGAVCGRVLGSPDRWEKWVWTFAKAGKFDEITPYIPAQPGNRPLPRTVYEVVLGHYIQADKVRFKELLELWRTDLFDVSTIITTLENQLKFRDVREDSIEDGQRGRDWRIVVESLAMLYEESGRHREALREYIKLQDADSAFRVIRDRHLAEAVQDDIPGFIGLRVSNERLGDMSQGELEDVTREAIELLVDEALNGLVAPRTVVKQLEEKQYSTYLFFYLRTLWGGVGVEEVKGETKDRLVQERRLLVDDFADRAVELFADYDRPLLMDFLKGCERYGFEKAVEVCEAHSYIPELVYLYSKTGQTKRALYLIIDRLADVKLAISFAKEQADPDLWEDLLNYSMDKPRFIRGLLEEVGTAINPIKLVRRIPEGLEIDGLREGIRGIIREHEIQWSISSGVARVLRSEVAGLQRGLRMGQRRGIKFEVVVQPKEAHVEPKEVPGLEDVENNDAEGTNDMDGDNDSPHAHGHKTGSKDGLVDQPGHSHKEPQPGHCATCHVRFEVVEEGTLVGFACGHVFHLAHLLEALHPGQSVPADEGVYYETVERRPLVGSKVMHARLLRDRIPGCPVCKGKEGHGDCAH